MPGYRHARAGLAEETRLLSSAAASPCIARLMARPKPVTFDKQKTVADNRRVRYDYHVEETFEAGLALQGTEVKALRAGEASIKEGYAEVRDGQVWLVNANIPEYSHGNRLNHEPRRPRKLLLHEREIELFGAVERKGMTLVPLSIYFNSTGRAKVELALAKASRRDKRQSIKERDWKRDKARLMRERGQARYGLSTMARQHIEAMPYLQPLSSPPIARCRGAWRGRAMSELRSKQHWRCMLTRAQMRRTALRPTAHSFLTSNSGVSPGVAYRAE